VHRREFLLSAAALWGFSGPLARMLAAAGAARQAADSRWKTFDITTHVHVQQASGKTRVWLPTPLAVAAYQKTLGDTYQIEGGSASMIEREGIDILAADWPDNVDPILTLTSRVATTDYAVDLTTPTVPPPKDFSAFSPYLRVAKAPQTDDAAAKAAALAASTKTGTDLDHARSLFDWVVGKSESNALFVSLARSAGVPARVVHGLRVSAADATRAQSDRAEAYLVGYGWVPVDATDRRFGSWEMQWIAFNNAQDVVLPGITRGSLPAFMHPHGETAGRRLDNLDPESFRYSITVQVLE
jgi:hypothetical protein